MVGFSNLCFLGLVSIASAAQPTAHLLIPGWEVEGQLSASIVKTDKSGTSYAVACPTSNAHCGLPPDGLAVSQGSNFAIAVDDYDSISQNCSFAGTTSLVCTAHASLSSEFNFSGSPASEAFTDVVITAGVSQVTEAPSSSKPSPAKAPATPTDTPQPTSSGKASGSGVKGESAPMQLSGFLLVASAVLATLGMAL